MTAADYRAALDRLGLSQVAAAKVLGVNPRTSRRWALGESGIPVSVGKLLRLIEEEERLRS
jgi:DNA-binding transcriptional regulator YiaG